MGKKSDTAKPASAIAEAPASTVKTTKAAPVTAAALDKPTAALAKPAAAEAKPAAARPPATNGDGAPAKTAAKKSPVKRTVTKKPVTFSTEDIALRAYYIAEHRQRLGLHGDSHSDWVEAERQLKKELKPKTATKKPALKKKRA